MLEVTQTQESGYKVFKFEANNTEYEVLTNDNKEYQVWSNRKGCASDTVLKVYGSLQEMGKRSKALNHLSMLIAA